MAANKKNPYITKTNKKGNHEGLGRPRGASVTCFGTVLMSLHRQSTCSQSNHSRILVEIEPNADTYVVGSNILLVGNYVDVYGFDKDTKNSISCNIVAAIAYEDPVTNSTVIIMINQAIKINSITSILVCQMQYQVHCTVVNEYPKFLSPKPSEDDHALLVNDTGGCSPAFIILLSLDGVTSYFEARCPRLVEYEDKTIPKYHLTCISQPWDPLVSLHSSHKDGMVDHRGHIIAECSTDHPFSGMPVGSVFSATYTAIKQLMMTILWQSSTNISRFSLRQQI